MTEYEWAIRDAEILKSALMIALNGIALYFTLLKFNFDDDVKCYASVELMGIMGLVPETISLCILIIPILFLYIVVNVNIVSISINVSYLCLLWIFRKRIIAMMRKI